MCEQYSNHMVTNQTVSLRERLLIKAHSFNDKESMYIEFLISQMQILTKNVLLQRLSEMRTLPQEDVSATFTSSMFANKLQPLICTHKYHECIHVCKDAIQNDGCFNYQSRR